ncbi:unnamed protein product [Cylindrotheca closterium]|uniref:Uncharacterized protein n=1 Tax=Cylindrotheca closterium TaxID=2856 RepID=A0AAD2CVK1_9STRA|nr:unnamed protein product [Cylindrotheca closterium]
MENSKDRDDGLSTSTSIHDDGGGRNHYAPRLSDTKAGFPENQVQTRMPLYENNIRSNDQHWKRSLKRPCPSNENRVVIVEDEATRKRQKQRVWMIVRSLMRYLETKDYGLYKTARTILGDCAKRHVLKDKGYTNLIDSVQSELKRAVGTRYWERAERHVSNRRVTIKAIEETKLRKHRFWMIVRVLMRYLEKKDTELHKKARTSLEECEKRHVMKEQRFANLVDSVQRELTQVVGMSYWKRAESHVAKHVIRNATTVKEGPSAASRIEQHDQQLTDPSAELKSSFDPPR